METYNLSTSRNKPSHLVTKGLVKHSSRMSAPKGPDQKFKKSFSELCVSEQANTSNRDKMLDKSRSAGSLKRGSSFRKSFANRLKSLPSFRQKFQFMDENMESSDKNRVTRNKNALSVTLDKIGLKSLSGKGFRKKIFRRFRSQKELPRGDTDLISGVPCSGNVRRIKHLQHHSSTNITMKLKSRLTSTSEQVDFSDLITPVAFHPCINVPKKSINTKSGVQKHVDKRDSTDTVKQSTECSTHPVGAQRGELGAGNNVVMSDREEMNITPEIENVKADSGVSYTDNGKVVIAECPDHPPTTSIISPTCADIYGQDEGIDVSFSFSQEHIFSQDKPKESAIEEVRAGKSFQGISDTETNDSKTRLLTSAQYNILQSTDGQLGQAVPKSVSKQSCEKPAEGSEQIIDTEIEAKPDITKVTSNEIQGLDEVDNPWILRTDIVELPLKRQEPNLKSRSFISEYSVDDSLGFSINQWNENENKSYNGQHHENIEVCNTGPVVRTNSVESMDSFSSSVHSAHSEDLFFSASEPEIEPDQISVSSSGSSPVGKPKGLLKIEEADEQVSPAFVHKMEDLTNNKKKTDKDKFLVKSLNDLNKLDTGIASTPRRISSYLSGLRSLSFEKSGDKLKIGKHEKLSQRRSLDSNLKIQQMSLDLNMNESPSVNGRLTNSSDSGLSVGLSPVGKNNKSSKKARRHTLNAPGDADSSEQQSMQNKLNKSSESGLNSALSPVDEKNKKSPKKARRRTVDVTGDDDNRRFYTLPARRKVKSDQQESPRRRVTRIASISKMFSDKAQSLSNIRLGSSFKLRNTDGEKNKVPSFLKTASLTNLMAKKGAEMASSISTLIRGRSNTNIVVNSPFKQKEKPKCAKVDEKSEFHYEKVRILCKRERPVTCEEFTAWKRRLTLNIELANTLTAEETMRLRADSVVRKSRWSGSDNGSIGVVRSPTLLDEIMKSVDNTRFRSLSLVGDIEVNESEDEDSSNEGTVSYVFRKPMGYTGVLPRSPLDHPLYVCHKCGNKVDLTNNEGVSKQIENIPNSKLSHSLCDLSKKCKCSTFKKKFSKTDNVKQNPKRSSSVHETQSEVNSPISSEFSGISSSSSSPNSANISGIQGLSQFSSMFELRDSKRERETTEVSNQETLQSQNSSPGSLLRHKPLLDLSADNLDVTDETDSGVVIYDTDRSRRERRSQSCDDLTHCDTQVVTPDGDSFYSCTDMTDSDMLVSSHHRQTATKAHSCNDILNEAEHILIDNSLKHEETAQHRKEMRKAKVKSLSSSHDALSLFVHVEHLDIDVGTENDQQESQKGDKETQAKHSKNKAESSCKSNTHDKLKITHRDNVCDKTKTGDHPCDNALNTDIEGTVREGLSCNTLTDKRDVCNPVIVKRRGRAFSERVGASQTLMSKPPLPKQNNRKVLSVNDITTCDKLGTSVSSNDKRYSMIEMSGQKSMENMSIQPNSTETEQYNRKEKMQKITVKSQSCDFINSTSSTPKLTETSNSPHTKPKQFLFDEEHIQSYTLKPSDTTNKHTPIQKSVSSGNVPKDSFDSQLSSYSSSSMFSLNRLSQSYSDDVFKRLSSLSPPQTYPAGPSPEKLLSLDGFINFNDTNEGFSRFSDLPTSPNVFPDVSGPDMDTVFKYDVCLGYLLHSVQCDNRIVCFYSFQRNKQLMESLITPLAVIPDVLNKAPNNSNHVTTPKQPSKAKCEDLPNPAAPITSVPSQRLLHAGQVLRTVLLARAPHMIRDRKFHLRTYRRCMVGTEMVDWLMQQCSLVHTRNQAVGMWQALVEEGVVVHVCHEHQFQDKYLFYRFHEDDEGVSTVPSSSTKRECEEELQEMFLMLAQIGPDAMMRMILRKLPHERTVEDLEIIYEELLHIKALSHLSTMVKRELASVLVFESHAKSGTVLFNQGDEGKSWYIILKGSVNVVIYGKGVVCTLHEGDDFGKLALVNDAPRAATIVLRDDNCHFLRVDKDDFNRILRDVEANTVRLKEHGQDVLVLEKIPSNTQTSDGTIHAHYKYSVMAGTPEKMLEHLLETRLDNKKEDEIDGFLEDFILTHVIFMPCNHLCPVLLSHYHSSATETTEQEGCEFMYNHKKCVLHFVQEWSHIVGHAFKEDHTINAFLEELHSCVLDDLVSYPSLRDDLVTLETVLQSQTEIAEGKSKKRASGNFTLSRKPSSKDSKHDQHGKKKSIRPTDENIFKVYCADHTYSTLKLSMDTNVENLLLNIKEKLGLGDDLILCEVKSSGERIILKENDLCVTSGLSINGRLFVTPREHLDALTPLPEQEGPSEGTFTTIETFSSREMAYYMTLYDWELFTSVQEYELIYQVFGRYKFQKITANLDFFLRRFNEIQFWIVTEMVLTTQLSKRVALLRKFIKLAAHCKEYQNLNSFFAVVMGLSNIAVSRLSQTWEKLPSKFKKMFVEFETLMDPSRNHRVYRLTVAKMAPPILPFMPLLMKDMTFTHEGNKTYFDGLVNFEKMRMISQTLKTVKFCRKINIDLEMPGSTKSADAMSYIRNFHVIDNQRLLTQLSHKLEPRKT